MNTSIPSSGSAPYLRTSLGPGETPSVHKDGTGAMYVRTSVGPDEIAGTDRSASVQTRRGNGDATRPSQGGILSQIRDAFSRFANTVRDSPIGRAYQAAKDFVATHFQSPNRDWMRKLDVDTTTGASAETLQRVRDIVRDEMSQRVNDPTEFLRRDVQFKELLIAAVGNFACNMALDAVRQLPAHKLVLTDKAVIESSNNTIKENHPEIHERILNNSWSTPIESHVTATLNHLEHMFGSDQASARSIADAYPQAMKDIYRAAVDTIKNSSYEVETKAEFERMFLPNIFLAVVNPRLVDVTLPNGVLGKLNGAPQKIEPTTLECISLTQMTKINQSILNSSSDDKAISIKQPPHPMIKAAVQDRIPQIRINIEEIKKTLYEGGRVS